MPLVRTVIDELANVCNYTTGVFDAESKASVSTVFPGEPLPIPSLKVKRLDYYYSRWGKTWKYRNMNSKVTVETLPIIHSGGNDPWKDCSFVIVRTLPMQEKQEPTFKLIVKSEYILKVCKDVIQEWPGISWNSDPLELDPEMFLTFLPQITEYRDALQNKKDKHEQDTHVLNSVNLLISSLSTDYHTTLATIKRLTSHSEITFERLYAILIPRTIFVARCAITGLPRLFKLMSFQRTSADGKPVYQLLCESVDVIDRGASQTVGKVQTIILLKYFKGTIDIQSLDAYPMRYHPDEKKLRETLLRRGKKWVSLIGVHHKQYDGVAALKLEDKLVKHNVKGRIMVDRATFRRLNANYQFPIPSPSKNQEEDIFVVPHHTFSPHSPIPFDGPVPIPMSMPPNFSPIYDVNHGGYANGGYANGTLVETRNDEEDITKLDLSEEDLILTSTVVTLGKGHGLVINLFGPPGVGKTFSAEATSEHVKRPLYVVGGGDLGTRASDMDSALERIFDIATAWKAIVLIDEADVFLEQRSLHDLERNAMVAVFLRYIEYYRGILFLTTNRVQTFDEAFLSRIHVALHLRELTHESKEQIWTAFIKKLGVTGAITPQQIQDLAARDVNGRQIKNAVRTAHSLALSRGQKVGFAHFAETLDAMEEFTKEFQGLRAPRS
ncbi:hypothetical protein BDZ94DRAFT_1350405 [Collybia nuda]|uniref:AAA+ ATPase domain-containing protein n=1 Tax=Collybia nuda TaxID=64659 RepID=A0A9P5XSW1_9AGAR|nr:hypothetical protein BDZ94DRAFT_1350405 [Collybia nuda]